MLPGTDFGFKETELFFRIAFVDFDGEKILESYQKNTCIDEDFIKKTVRIFLKEHKVYGNVLLLLNKF
ncbi:MAG: hypothetical protein GKR88_19985 [Flavobacteriaceae bacterium]|nr:MAG: hypothetical protein GKR88_19985 [Flavobacteriaceae bacterium]